MKSAAIFPVVALALAACAAAATPELASPTRTPPATVTAPAAPGTPWASASLEWIP